MDIKVIQFERSANWSARMEKIKEELQALMPIEIVEAMLNKKDYPDQEYGYGGADLVFADSLTVTYRKIEVNRCTECGCQDLMACQHDELGPCGWVKPGLCSHCDLEAKGMITDVIRPWQKATGKSSIVKPMKELFVESNPSGQSPSGHDH